MFLRMDGWWTCVRMCGQTYESTYVYRWTDGQMDIHVYGRTDRQTDGWTDVHKYVQRWDPAFSLLVLSGDLLRLNFCTLLRSFLTLYFALLQPRYRAPSFLFLYFCAPAILLHLGFRSPSLRFGFYFAIFKLSKTWKGTKRSAVLRNFRLFPEQKRWNFVLFFKHWTFPQIFPFVSLKFLYLLQKICLISQKNPIKKNNDTGT
jgi:hypothetical protein